MEDKKHTPLPYSVPSDDYSQGVYIGGDVLAEGANDFGNTHALMATTSTTGCSNLQRRCNAEFIVRACNSHYELLEALREIYNNASDCPASEGLKNDSWIAAKAKEIAIAAIAKAEGNHE